MAGNKSVMKKKIGGRILMGDNIGGGAVIYICSL
jgi:hypothetical protein